MEYKPSFGTTSLKNLRIAHALKQDEVAEAIGTNANTISRWERGIAIPSLYYRRKLADYFGIDPQKLFSDINDEEVRTMAPSSDAKLSSPAPVKKDPKGDASAIGEYFNLDITIMAGHFVSPEHADSRGKDYPVYASFSKGGEAKTTMQFPFDDQTLAKRLLDVEQGVYNVYRVSLPEREQTIQNFGRDLFNALFCGTIYTLYETVKRRLNRENGERLRIRLRIHSSELAVLPWELMYDPHTRFYVCLDRSVSLIRYQELEDPYTPLQVELPLNILGMDATLKDQEQLDIKSEKRAIKSQLKPLSKSVKLNWLSGSGWDDLRKAMRRGPWHIFHFIGHGSFNTSTNEGFLWFGDKGGNSVPVNARDLSLLLDHPSLRLVILNTCEGARADRTDAFGSIASFLAQRNIPAIIAMQYKITDKASIKFARAFYETLIKGQPIDAALLEARFALKSIPFSLEWIIPVLHMRSRDGNLFTLTSELPAILPPPPDSNTEITIPVQERKVIVNPSSPVLDDELPVGEAPVSPPPSSNTDKTTVVLPPRVATDHSNETEDASQTDHKTPRVRLTDPSQPLFIHKVTRFAYIAIAVIIIVILALGSIFVYASFLGKPSPDLFSTLCSGNFQSTNTSIVPTPAISPSPDGEPTGLSEGANIFDLQRPNQQEVQYKLQAAQDTVNNPQDVVSSLQNALGIDQTDAEAQIYLENWKVLGSNHPHITLVVGVNFASTAAPISRGTLQGAFTAQKECNNQNQQDSSKTLIVLMIANIGGNTPDDSARSAMFVANQIADQASKDPTILAIMGWRLSADSINVNHQLKIRGSHLLMVSPSSSSDELAGMSNFFRVCPTNSEQAQIAANFILKTKQKKNIAIVYDETTSYGNNLREDFAKDVPDNMVGSPASFKGGDPKTLQNALKKVLDQKPDAIFFAGYVTDLSGLLKDVSSTPYANLLIMGANALANTNAYPNPLPDLHNIYFTSFASPNQWDGTNPKPPFFHDYQNNFGTLPAPTGLSSIDAGAMLGYDGMLTLLYGSQQVLSTKDTITPSDLTQALKQITIANPIQGVTGRIAFDNNGSQDPSKMIFVEHIQGTNLVIDEIHGCLQKDKCGS